MQPKATVIIPTHDHCEMLWRSVGSVLNQTVENIEIFIIGDGVPDLTHDVVADIQKQDKRVRFFNNPKGHRNGEIYRHAAMAKVRGEIICYLSDDDLYFPNHIETMYELLQEANFANALPIKVNPDGTLGGWTIDLSLHADREFILFKENRIPLSCGAHTLKMYLQLPYGWRITPKGTPTDYYMWQQFLAHPNCHATSSKTPTVLAFPSPQRRSLSMEQRCEELDRWRLKLADPTGRAEIDREALEWAARDRERLASLSH